MKCPIDNTDLVMTERQGIEIDYCPRCRGVWLDRGELDKLIERSAPANAGRQDPGHRERPESRSYETQHRGEPHHRKRRESLLGELFDF